jgi:predicted enzyme involved in methoxymalonyl-ACP biosynthesis
VISASLRDRLSDSGLIGAMVCSRRDGHLVVDEMAMSCRALGRGVETPLALAVLRRVVDELSTTSIVFPFTAGPRNEPARRWLQAFTGEELSAPGQASVEWDGAAAGARLAEAPIVVRWADEP